MSDQGGTRARGSTASGSIPEIGPGTIIATGGEDWLLLEELGGGGMSRTFRAMGLQNMVSARHKSQAKREPLPMGITQCPQGIFDALTAESLHQPVVVLKLIDRPPTDEFYAEFVERLMQEAELCGTMGSIQFPSFAGTVRRKPIPFFVMELIRGTSLQAFLDERYLTRRIEVPWPMIYQIMGQLLYAIREAHKRGCIHRDLKPENIMVVEMAPFGLLVRVIDFGFAKVLAERQPGLEHLAGTEGRRTRQLTTAESPWIASLVLAPPEAYTTGTERQSTPAYDIYMLGGILYWMVMGETFLPETREVGVAVQAMTRPVPRIVRRDLGMSSNERLNTLVRKMLQVEQTRRPQSVDEVIRAFEEIEKARLREEAEKAARATARATGAITAPPTDAVRAPRLEEPQPMSTSRIVLIATGVGLAIVALAAAAVFLFR